ncbi:DUF3865 domain-containing protein [Shewanella sp. MBTL60-007]|uniref:DUF3865 domain-containing protein n=1 Tax=Shewanella sp. MBTL60-007 TaxID=2815911 RepID=UPI001BC5C0D2|nr:DUF3865 domain-containing protein [Shewanella sp. MBTL60-007]GIU12675.1 hypothetical protein TUM3792_01430 [Shewanella sp. MBTL60-007]
MFTVFNEKNTKLFSSIKENASVIADNVLLLNWKVYPDKINYESFCIFVNNLQQWLAPTAYRLSLGLNLLQNESDPKFSSVVDAFEHNIDDESGERDIDRSHAKLFIDSCETTSQVLYGKSLQLSNSQLTIETINLHKQSTSLFNSNTYRMLGASVAQETHALPQLENLYAGLCKVRDKFNDNEWFKATEFYDIHLDGTEARHAEDLNKTIWEIIDNEEKMNEFKQGSQEFFVLLNNYWNKLNIAVSAQCV